MGARKDSPRSSGESDATKASLKMNAAKVTRKLTRRQIAGAGELKSECLKVSAYVRITRAQNVF